MSKVVRVNHAKFCTFFAMDVKKFFFLNFCHFFTFLTPFYFANVFFNFSLTIFCWSNTCRPARQSIVTVVCRDVDIKGARAYSKKKNWIAQCTWRAREREPIMGVWAEPPRGARGRAPGGEPGAFAFLTFHGAAKFVFPLYFAVFTCLVDLFRRRFMETIKLRHPNEVRS